MKLLLILWTILPTLVYSQELSDTTIFEFPDVEAQYPGGTVELHRFIINNMVYPDSIVGSNPSGTLYVSFIVEKDGTLTSVQTERSSGTVLDDNFVALIQKMPNWIPAQVKGKVVRSKCRLPMIIHFK